LSFGDLCPDLCELNQNEADCEFILSPSELMSGRGVSVGSKLWIWLLRSQLAIVLHLQEWPEKVNNNRM